MNSLLLLATFILTISTNTFSFTVLDKQEDLISIKRTFDIFNVRWRQPKNIPLDFAYNNSNGKISPGEMVVINLDSNSNRNYECNFLVNVGDGLALLSQEEYRTSENLMVNDCLDGVKDNCLVDIYQSPLSYNHIILALNKWIVPGVELVCFDENNPIHRFSKMILD